MKAKVLILLVISAVVTLSFTIKGKPTVKNASTTEQHTASAAGGMESEDPIK